MLYTFSMFVPAPVIFLRLRGKNFMGINDLEIDRARQQSPHCRVLSFSDYQKKLRAAGAKHTGFAAVIQKLLRERNIRSIAVPSNFPLGLATELSRLRVKVNVKRDFFSEREQ